MNNFIIKEQSEGCSFLLNVKGRMGFKDKKIKWKILTKHICVI